MQPERLGSQRLATEIFKDAAIVMCYCTVKLLPVLQPRRDGVAIGARQQLDAVDVAGQLRQLVSGIFYRQMLHGAAQLGRHPREVNIGKPFERSGYFFLSRLVEELTPPALDQPFGQGQFGANDLGAE